MTFAHPEFLVTTDWLANHLNDDNVRIFETTVFLRRGAGAVRAESGRSEYERGHIPGAGFLDLQADFSDNDQPYRFMMPGPDAFAAAAGRHGISESCRLVLYDRLGSQWAARFWWMFRAMGCRDAVVLDGGWQRWTAEQRAVAAGPAAYPPATFAPSFDPARFADLAEVRAFIESGSSETNSGATGGGAACLINALGRDQHSGADGGQTYGRAGHIPGATNVPSGELTDPDTGLFRPAGELAALFAAAGADPAQRVVTYCGGGIAASNDAFILAMLGYENVAVYDASMSEYAADPSLPLVAD